jgi:CRP-like cAMP-binding protein
LADKEFQGNILVRGLALREVLVDCRDGIIEQGDSERGLHNTCEFLRLVKEGMSLTAIGKTLGVSREHVTRVYKRKAVELLTKIFLSTIRDGRCA